MDLVLHLTVEEQMALNMLSQQLLWQQDNIIMFLLIPLLLTYSLALQRMQ